MISIGLTKSEGGGTISQRIDKLSGGLGYCHAFLVFHDFARVFEAHADFGVRFIPREVDPWREVLHPVPLSAEQEKAVLKKCMDMAGNEYDFMGVTHFVLKFIKEDSDKQFCSEAVVIALQAAGLLMGAVPSEVSPNGLSQMLPV